MAKRISLDERVRRTQRNAHHNVMSDMHPGHFDACCKPLKGSLCYTPSDHTYRYAAGFGDDTRVTYPMHAGATDDPVWCSAYKYNYGIGKPHYPVPAIISDVTYWIPQNNPFMLGYEIIAWRWSYSRRESGVVLHTPVKVWYC